MHSATVRAARCLDADAGATAVFNMATDQATGVLAFARRAAGHGRMTTLGPGDSRGSRRCPRSCAREIAEDVRRVRKMYGSEWGREKMAAATFDAVI